GVVQRVGPGAARQHEAAVAVIAHGGCLVGKLHRIVIAVGVRDGQRTAGGLRAVFGHRAGGDAANDGAVFTAVDGDGDGLRAAVGGGVGDAVGHAFAGVEELHRGVVQRVGPGAARQHEAAVAAIAHGGCLVGKLHRIVIAVGVRDGQRAAGGLRAVFGHRAGGDAANDGAVFTAVDGDGDGLRAAVGGGVGDADRKAIPRYDGLVS